VSYILDALKKSEAERSRGVVPTLLTPSHATFRSSAVGWILIAVLIVNAGLFAAWLYWPRDVGTTTVPVAEPTPAATPDFTPSTVAPSTAAPSSVATPASAASAPAASAAPSNSMATQPNAIADSQLARDVPVEPEPVISPSPTPIRRSTVASADSGTADLSFSTHVYGTDPSMRAVTMDGKRYVEGDEIRPGVRIREITETGVILDVNGRPIPVDVLQDWR
jgi:general secretion pathway protein B